MYVVLHFLFHFYVVLQLILGLMMLTFCTDVPNLIFQLVRNMFSLRFDKSFFSNEHFLFMLLDWLCNLLQPSTTSLLLSRSEGSAVADGFAIFKRRAFGKPYLFARRAIAGSSHAIVDLLTCSFSIRLTV